MIEAADAIISKIDVNKMSVHFGLKIDTEDPNEGRIRKDYERQRDSLVEAIMKKGIALQSLANKKGIFPRTFF